MKQLQTILLALILCFNCSEQKKTSELKPLLSNQLKYSHDSENWFAPLKITIADLSAEQVNWKDSTNNHSIGELVSHLTFWNEMQLKAFKGEDLSNFKIDNDTTFLYYSENDWQQLVIKLDSVQSELLHLTDNATEDQLSEWADNMLNLSAHNAYHSGQILYIRKLNGWWNR